MNDKIQELAKKSGFIFWKDEPWGPGPGNIDWSCDYTDEFKVFANLLQKQTRKETIQEVVSLLKELHEITKGRHNYYLCAANLIEEDFKE